MVYLWSENDIGKGLKIRLDRIFVGGYYCMILLWFGKIIVMLVFKL